MPSIVGILTFISMLKYNKLESSLFVGILVLWAVIWIEPQKSFITSGPGPLIYAYWVVIFDLF